MGKALKGIAFILLGLLMLAWFAYSIMNPPTRPSETYSMDWVLIVVRLFGAIAFLVGGAIELLRK